MKLSKKLIAPIVTIAAFGAIGVGTTYALFTSDAKTDIVITSGSVKASASIENLKLYSADATLTEGDVVPGGDQLGQFSAKYRYKDMTSQAHFLDGGTASYASPLLTIDRMAPGDKITADYDISNSSNIDIKYRLVAECTSESIKDLKFFSALEFSAFNKTNTSVKRFVTNWTLWPYSSNPAEMQKTETISLAMPITLGNEYQENHTNIRLMVEAVQGNAYTVDEPDTFLSVTEKPVAVESGHVADTTIKSSTSEKASDGMIVTIPADSKLVVGSVEQSLTINDSLLLKIESSEDNVIILQDKEKALCYDVSVVNQDGKQVKNNGTQIVIKYYVGDAVVQRVYHEGTELGKDSPKSGATEYYLLGTGDDEGYVVIYAKEFSPYSVVYKEVEKEVSVSKEGEPTVKLTLLKFAENVNNGENYKDCTVTLLKDVDISGSTWEPIGKGSRATLYSGKYFAGTFDGANYTISGLTCGTPDAPDTIYSGKKVFGLFGAINDATIKNLNISNVGIYSTSDTVGGIAAYCFGSCEIKDCKVLSGTISAVETFGGVLGRSYNNDGDTENEVIKIENCENSATIIKTGATTNVKASGILGYVAAAAGTDVATNTAHVINCTNNGMVKVETSLNGYVSGVVNFGYSGGSVQKGNEYFVFTSDTNNGDLYLSDAKSHVHVKTVNYIGTECSSGSNTNCTSNGHKNTGIAYRKSIEDASYTSILTKYVNPSNGSSVDREADADFIVVRMVGDERAMNLEEISLRVEAGEKFDNWTFTLRRNLNPESVITIGTLENPFKGIIVYGSYTMNNVIIYSGND